MTMQVNRTWLLVLALLAVAALAACGNDDDSSSSDASDDTDGSTASSDDATVATGDSDDAPAPTEPPRLTVPDGWTEFTEFEYSGAVRPGWVYQTLDTSMFTGDTSTILSGLPEDTRQALVANLASQDLDDVLYVYVDPEHPTFTSNINILTCGDAAGIALDADIFLDVYAGAGIEAEQAATLTVMGDETNAFRIAVNPAFETYQVPFRAGGECEAIATFIGLGEDPAQFDDFITFMEHLRLTN